VGCPSLKHLKPPAIPESLGGSPREGKGKGGGPAKVVRRESRQLSISAPLKGLTPRCSIVLMMAVSLQSPLGSFRGLSKQ